MGGTKKEDRAAEAREQETVVSQDTQQIMLHIFIVQLVNIQVSSYAENSPSQVALHVYSAQVRQYHRVKLQPILRSL